MDVHRLKSLPKSQTSSKQYTYGPNTINLLNSVSSTMKLKYSKGAQRSKLNALNLLHVWMWSLCIYVRKWIEVRISCVELHFDSQSLGLYVIISAQKHLCRFRRTTATKLWKSNFHDIQLQISSLQYYICMPKADLSLDVRLPHRKDWTLREREIDGVCVTMWQHCIFGCLKVLGHRACPDVASGGGRRTLA